MGGGENLIISVIKMIFVILMIGNFALCAYFFYLSKVKKIKINESLTKVDKKEFKIVFGDGEDEPAGIIAGGDITIGKYKVLDIVNTINNFTESFNLTNKRVNISSAIVTLFSGLTCLASVLIVS